MQSIVLLLGLFADAISASSLGQQPLGHTSSTELPGQLAEGLRKPVRGRFLHITGEGTVLHFDAFCGVTPC